MVNTTYILTIAHLFMHSYISIFTVHYTTSCITQSSAPEVGRMVARNMSS
jgi:hypothetical protein